MKTKPIINLSLQSLRDLYSNNSISSKPHFKNMAYNLSRI